MKRRFACNIDDNYNILEMNDQFFEGYIVYLKHQNVEKPLIVYNGKNNICIKDNNYEWIEVYPKNGKFAITIMFDDKGNLIEWYFDIAKDIGIENGIPYEDDLYLDMVITPKGEKIILDEEELLDARKNGIITQEDVNTAYSVLKDLEIKYATNLDELQKLTKHLLSNRH